MKRAALLLALLASGCAATPVPTRDELLDVLLATGGQAVAPGDLTHIACEQVSGAPGSLACRWRQRDGRRWQDWQAYLSHVGDRWELASEPSLRP